MIRIAGPGDRALLEALMREFYAESGYPLDEAAAFVALGRLMGDPSLGRVWMVDADDGACAGYVVVAFGFSLEHLGRDAFLDEIYLRPDHRGSGLGNRVLEAVEPECRALGVRTLHLEVERDNPAGQSLYRKRGYRDNGRHLLSKRLVE